MNWFAEQRQAWIGETLRIFGFINRDHLIRKFGISSAQAAIDMREFQAGNPGAVKYDASAKRYVSPKADHDAHIERASQKEGGRNG